MQNEAQRMRTALLVAAQIVARDGEVFLPVFVRLEKEVQAQEERKKAFNRALALITDEASITH